MNSNRVALVTGGGTGIGKAAAKALLHANYQVVITGRNLDKLQAALKDIGGTDANTLAVTSDVGDPESVKQLFASLKAKFGRIDVLFNNAGTASPPIPMEDLSYTQWMNVVNANLTGSFLCAQEAMRMMKAQSPKGGRIINNGSISANTPRPFSAPCHQACDYRVDQIECTRWSSRSHRLQPDRHRQCGHRDDTGHQQRRDSGGWVTEGGTDDGCRACWASRGANCQSAFGEQCSVHDHHGDEHALCGARVVENQVLQSERCSTAGCALILPGAAIRRGLR